MVILLFEFRGIYRYSSTYEQVVLLKVEFQKLA